MSINLNVAHVAGRLTRDPELKVLPSGQQVATLSIATNSVYTKDGVKHDNAEYHNVVIYGKQAENTAQYMKKGYVVLVSGRLQTQSWEKDGVKHYRTEIVADKIQFGDAPVQPKVGNTNVDYSLPDETNEPSGVPF